MKGAKEWRSVLCRKKVREAGGKRNGLMWYLVVGGECWKGGEEWGSESIRNELENKRGGRSE